MDRQVILLAVVGLHLAVAIVHGSAHALVPVELGPLLNGFVLVTVFLGPVAGVLLERRGHPLGIPIFTIAMTAGLVLGGVLHFLVENPDHVAALPASPWSWLFRASAVGVFATPALGVAAGLWYWVGEACGRHGDTRLDRRASAYCPAPRPRPRPRRRLPRQVSRSRPRTPLPGRQRVGRGVNQRRRRGGARPGDGACLDRCARQWKVYRGHLTAGTLDED